MLSLRPLQRALQSLYGLDARVGGAPAFDVDDFVRPMPGGYVHARRREVLRVSSRRGDVGVELLLHDDVFAALRGVRVAGFSRFDAWCAAVEGVSHLTFLAYRAAHERPVSQLELELQAEVDKYALAVLERVHLRAPAEGAEASQRLRTALYRSVRFHDAEHSVRGRRYRTANRWAARYTAGLEHRFVRQGKLDAMVAELRGFYRRGVEDKRHAARAA